MAYPWLKWPQKMHSFGLVAFRLNCFPLWSSTCTRSCVCGQAGLETSACVCGMGECNWFLFASDQNDSGPVPTGRSPLSNDRSTGHIAASWSSLSLGRSAHAPDLLEWGHLRTSGTSSPSLSCSAVTDPALWAGRPWSLGAAPARHPPPVTALESDVKSQQTCNFIVISVTQCEQYIIWEMCKL